MDIEYGSPLEIGEIKASGDSWTVEGYVSTFGNTDLGGDVMMRSAFDDTLAKARPVRFLYSHRTDQVLGTAKSLKVDDKGLLGVFQISKTTLGSDVHTLLRDKALDSFSIGYLVDEAEFDDSGVRLLKKVDLMECSVVALPMNPRAVVTRVKADLPFDQVLVRAVEHLKLGVSEAEALHARRASEERELTERHLAAIRALHPEAKAFVERLEALLVALAPIPEATGDDVEVRELRRKLLRRRLARHGINVEAA